MLKYLLFVSIIFKLALSESEDDEELATVELNMETFSELAPYIDTYNDEISAEMAKTCKQIKKRKACLQAFSKAPVGIVTGRRGNDSPGECMYFNRRNNKVVQALGNQCLPANEVTKYVQANRVRGSPPQDEDEQDNDDEADAVEMSEGLFDKISSNAPSQDNIDEEMMKYCKEIKKENVCLKSTSMAPVGRITNRRGNDGPGECMYFQRKNNPVVQALGNQCLPPNAVINYKQGMTAVQALADESEEEDDEDDINSVEISMQTWDTLSLYMNDADLSADARTIVGCNTIKLRRECLNKGVTPKSPNGMDTNRRGNDNPGECMWFRLKNNAVVQYYGNRCLAPKAVREYKKNIIKYQVSAYDIDDYNNEDGLDLIEIDSIEMNEELFDVLSKYAPDEDDMELINTDTGGQIVGCKTIKSKRECINKGVSPKAPRGIYTDRRGNDKPGECMYFNRRNNPIVQYYNSRCLAPKAVKSYQKMQNPPLLDAEDDTDGLAVVELTVNTLIELSRFITDYNDEISAEMAKTCKQIKKKKACLQAFSKAPVGIVTNRRGNDSPGECMYFNRRNNKVVMALGNQCLPANEVKNYIQNHVPSKDEEELEDEDDYNEDNDSVEITEVLFDIISDNAPDTTSSYDIDQDAIMKYCQQIRTEKVCLRSTSRALFGRTTNRRGNDGPGECMYFKRKNNPVVQALGNQCLAPQAVISYQRMPPPMENELFASLGLIDEESQEINYSALSNIVFVMMVIMIFIAHYKLCKDNDDKYEEIKDSENYTRYKYHESI